MRRSFHFSFERYRASQKQGVFLISVARQKLEAVRAEVVWNGIRIPSGSRLPRKTGSASVKRAGRNTRTDFREADVVDDDDVQPKQDTEPEAT